MAGLLQWPLPQVLAAKLQQVEGLEDEPAASLPGERLAQQADVGFPLGILDDRFAVNARVRVGEAPPGVNDRR